MVVVIALAVATTFGAGDQYLGSFAAYPWAADVSLLSAPWLLLPFLAGVTQRDPKRAALLGLACTLSALFGYGLMTLSPVEHAHLTMRTAYGFIESSAPVIVGGLLTGPLFGWFGQRWRADRAWLGALVTSFAILLEPFALGLAGRAIRFREVSTAEIAAGALMSIYVVVSARRAATGHRAARRA